MAAGLDLIAEEAHRRAGRLPSGEVLLHSFVQALNLDGSRAPFYSEARRIAALLVRHRGRPVRIDGTRGEPWLVAEFYLALDEVAENYVNSWSRAPHLRELIHYLRYHLQEAEVFGTRVSDKTPWNLREARFVLRKERKPEERAGAPNVASPPEETRGRVSHPKFGDGDVVGEEGGPTDRAVRERTACRFAVIRKAAVASDGPKPVGW